MTEDVEESVTTTSAAKGGGPERNEMVSEYLPGDDEWAAKTVLDLEDPGRIAVLRQMDQIYPEVEDLQPVLDQFLDEFLPAKTSIAGKSRDEYKEIFEAMFGAQPDGDSSGMQLAAALGVEQDD